MRRGPRTRATSGDSGLQILHVISSFPPAYAYGGPVTSSYHLGRALVENGHEVTVFTTDACDANSRVTRTVERKDGILVRRFRNVSNGLAWRNLPFAPTMGFALARNLPHFDVVHTHEFRSIHTALSHGLSSHYDVPHVLQPRGAVPRMRKSTRKRYFDRLVGTRMLRNADEIIVSSTVESNQLATVSSDISAKVREVPNGLEVGIEIPPEGTFRSRHNIATDETIVLFLSRIHERKGPDLVADAFRTINEEFEDAVLVFVGPDEGYVPELEAHLEALGLRENALFPGALYGNDKWAAYADADVFVLPSKDRYESFGNVVLESLACGTPVVMTDVCGVAEWIPSEFGRVVSPASGELAEAIVGVLESRDSFHSERAKQFVRQQFSWNEIAKRVEDVYTEVISE